MKTINVNIKNYIIAVITAFAVTATGCSGYMKSNSLSQLVYGLFFTTTPALNPLGITAVSSTSITLAQPTLFTSGNPFPTIQAYIGPDGLITITGSTVGGAITEGPVDVSAGPYTFNGLAGNTVYRIYVVAQNSSGYSVATITDSTGGIAPVLDNLVINSVDDQNIEVAMVNYITAGNPLPATADAYIGLDGTIAVTPLGVVSGSTDGPHDVIAGNYTFPGLTPNTPYRIIVVSSNTSGVSIRQITQTTGPSAPVLDPLVIGAVDDQNITLNVATYTTPGFPIPAAANAWIGLDGTITVTPLGAVGGSLFGPFDVDTLPHTFGGLTPNTPYRIIVVSTNASGVSIRQITQTTGPSAPVLDPLVIGAVDDQNITLNVATYTTAGFPVPAAANAYIGLDGVIAVSPLGAVTNETDGPYDVDSAPHTFAGLTPDMTYRIIVVSQNASGVSIRQITQTTGPSAPVLDPLAINSVDDQNIQLAAVSYATAGFPVPAAANAYIGLDGVIAVSPLGAVTNETDGPYDVDSAPHTFAGLTPNTTYRIIVVSQNASGVSIRQIVQTTSP